MQTKIKTKIAKFFSRIAKKLDYNTIDLKEMPQLEVPIIKYDIDNFEYVTARYTRPIEDVKNCELAFNTTGADYFNDFVKKSLVSELAKEIINRHESDIRKYNEWKGNNLTGNIVYEIRLLVEKPKK